jgi:hypothetical protein
VGNIFPPAANNPSIGSLLRRTTRLGYFRMAEYLDRSGHFLSYILMLKNRVAFSDRQELFVGDSRRNYEQEL